MSFLWNWMSDMLSYLGLWKKSGTLVFLGLDNAGKTTLMHMLRDDRMGQHVPTLYATKEELSIGGINIMAVDLGGHETARRVWKDYYTAVDAVLFIIDLSDQKRYAESKEELDGLLNDEQVSHCPFLILGNKIDKPGVPSEEEVKAYFGLHQYLTGKGNIPQKELQRRPVELFMCSILKRQGYGEVGNTAVGKVGIKCGYYKFSNYTRGEFTIARNESSKMANDNEHCKEYSLKDRQGDAIHELELNAN